jgi:hypothetical protein
MNVLLLRVTGGEQKSGDVQKRKGFSAACSHKDGAGEEGGRGTIWFIGRRGLNDLFFYLCNYDS